MRGRQSSTSVAATWWVLLWRLLLLSVLVQQQVGCVHGETSCPVTGEVRRLAWGTFQPERPNLAIVLHGLVRPWLTDDRMFRALNERMFGPLSESSNLFVVGRAKVLMDERPGEEHMEERNISIAFTEDQCVNRLRALPFAVLSVLNGSSAASPPGSCPRKRMWLQFFDWDWTAQQLLSLMDRSGTTEAEGCKRFAFDAVLRTRWDVLWMSPFVHSISFWQSTARHYFRELNVSSSHAPVYPDTVLFTPWNTNFGGFPNRDKGLHDQWGLVAGSDPMTTTKLAVAYLESPRHFLAKQPCDSAIKIKSPELLLREALEMFDIAPYNVRWYAPFALVRPNWWFICKPWLLTETDYEACEAGNRGEIHQGDATWQHLQTDFDAQRHPQPPRLERSTYPTEKRH